MMSYHNSGRRRLQLEPLERRLCLAASVGWDGIGLGSASLTYYIDNIPSSMDLTDEEVQSGIETALDAWAEVADITFTETDTAELDDSIDFTFDAWDGTGSELAYAYLPDDVNPEPIAGDVTFDVSEDWEIGNGLGEEAYDFVLVAVHEIGHSLGLDHSYLANSVMVATIDADQMFGGLGSSDEDAILDLYAPVPTLGITSLTLDETTVVEGEEVTLTGTYAEGDSAGTYTVTVDWGDGTNDTMAAVDQDEGTFETTHLYADDNPTDTEDDDCVVTVTVTNAVTGETDSANTLVNVENVDPTITSLSASLATAGNETILTGTIADPGAEDTLTVFIYWYDGSAQEIVSLPAGTTEFTVSHLFPNDPTSTSGSTYTVFVTAEDDDGGSDSAYTIANVLSSQSTFSDLGAVDFVTVEELSLVGESSYFAFDTTHDGTLTLEALESEASEGVLIKLYDRDPLEIDGIEPIAESSPVEGIQRIDQSTTAGQTYYLELVGVDSDLDLRVTNLIQLEDDALTVFGTEGDDEFEFSVADRTLVINNVSYAFDESAVTSVAFAGGDGYDTVILHDSSGDDTFEAWATEAVLSNTASDATADYSVHVEEFEELHAYARNGGHDTAALYDSDGDDKFKAELDEDYAKMYGGAMYNRVKFFDVVEAYSSGGSDLARLFDTAGDDTFEGQKDTSRLIGGGYDVQAHSFSQVIACATQGTDAASLSDSEMKDELHALAAKAVLFDAATDGEVYTITARHFDSYRTEASVSEVDGGDDIAKVWPTGLDDRIEATDAWFQFWVESDSSQPLHEIIGFETIKVRDTEGTNDSADVDDSVSYDLLMGEGWQ